MEPIQYCFIQRFDNIGIPRSNIGIIISGFGDCACTGFSKQDATVLPFIKRKVYNNQGFYFAGKGNVFD
jgi:hypothetical protein